jgi:hypothetical protein
MAVNFLVVAQIVIDKYRPRHFSLLRSWIPQVLISLDRLCVRLTEAVAFYAVLRLVDESEEVNNENSKSMESGFFLEANGRSLG